MPEPQPSQPSSPRAHIEAGNLVEHGGRSYQIKEVVDLSTVTAIDRETHETKVLPLAELQVVKQALGGVHVRALDDVAPEEEEIAKERLKAIQPLLDMPRFGRKDVEARAAEVSKSPETLYRWIRRYTGFRDHTSLVSHKRGRKKGSKWARETRGKGHRRGHRELLPDARTTRTRQDHRRSRKGVPQQEYQGAQPQRDSGTVGEH